MTALVWVECHNEEPSERGMTTLAFAQRLGAASGLEVAAVLIGAGSGAVARQLEGFELARLLYCDSPALEPYTPEPWRDALVHSVEETGARWLIAPHAYRSFDLLPAVAEQLEAGWVPEVSALRLAAADGAVELRRPVVQGRLEAWVRPRTDRTVITVGAVAGEVAGTGPLTGTCVAERSTPAQLEDSGREVVERREPNATVDLSAAQRLVAVGRGLGGPERLGPVEELACILGAEIAGSRPVIDAGWLERERQVGSSGQTVAPELYLALGISGAMQHLQGMSGSGCVVAVNKDASAPIFQSAQFGIVGDLNEVVPALIEALGPVAGSKDDPVGEG